MRQAIRPKAAAHGISMPPRMGYPYLLAFLYNKTTVTASAGNNDVVRLMYDAE
jgi:hypothetical protein